MHLRSVSCWVSVFAVVAGIVGPGVSWAADTAADSSPDFVSCLRAYLRVGEVPRGQSRLYVPCMQLSTDELRLATELLARSPQVRSAWYYLHEPVPVDLFASLLMREEPLDLFLIGVGKNGEEPWTAGKELVYPALDVRTVASLAHIPGLTELRLDAITVDAEALRVVASCEPLRVFSVCRCRGIRAGDLVPLARLRRLEALFVSDANFCDQDVAAFRAHPALRTIEARGSSLTDQALVTATSIKYLNRLDVRDTQVTERAARQFQQSRPDVLLLHGLSRRPQVLNGEFIRADLRSGRLEDDVQGVEVPCMFLTPQEVEQFTALVGTSRQVRMVSYYCAHDPPESALLPLVGSAHIEVLRFEVLSADGFRTHEGVPSPRPFISGKFLAPVGRMPGLKTIEISDFRLAAATIGSISRSPSLEEIRLERVSGLRTGEFAPLAQLSRLRSLFVRDVEFGNSDLSAMSQHPTLEDLAAHHCRVTDRGLPHFVPGSRLVTLDLFDNKVTAEGARMMQQLFPRVEFEYGTMD